MHYPRNSIKGQTLCWNYLTDFSKSFYDFHILYINFEHEYVYIYKNYIIFYILGNFSITCSEKIRYSLLDKANHVGV